MFLSFIYLFFAASEILYVVCYFYNSFTYIKILLQDNPPYHTCSVASYINDVCIMIVYSLSGFQLHNIYMYSYVCIYSALNIALFYHAWLHLIIFPSMHMKYYN